MSTPVPSSAGVLRRRRPARVLLVSLLLGSALALAAPAGPVSATSLYSSILRSGSGLDSSDPIVYVIDGFDCDQLASISVVELDISGINTRGKFFEIQVSLGLGSLCVAYPSETGLPAGSARIVRGSTDTVSFQMPASGGTRVAAGLLVDNGLGGSVTFVINATRPGSPAPDPTAATVAVAAEQAAAAGIAGSLNSVWVGGSDRDTTAIATTSWLWSPPPASGLPTATTRWLAANQGRLNALTVIGGTSAVAAGGTSVVSDDLEVQLGSTLGARADTGLLVPSGGQIGVSMTGWRFAPGSVIEVWFRSQPRLVAAARVPEYGGTVTFAIPTGAPLDGGEAIEDGAHTLELRMYTEDGFEIVATGVTIAQIVPTRIPAGEGPVPFGHSLPLLAAGLLVAVIAGRRMAVTD
jgi:hypothetical protein